jgi:hypothetical protein
LTAEQVAKRALFVLLGGSVWALLDGWMRGWW